ncbi:Transposase [compost metagenome]
MCGDSDHMSDRLRGDLSKADIRKFAETASPGMRTRLLAVADAQHGRPDRLVGLDHEVPGTSVARWVSQYIEHGLEALIDADLATVLDGEDPEIAAAAVHVTPPGIEKTALRAVAAACRGSSVADLAQHYMASEAEVEEWIAHFVDGGAEALAARYRRPDRKNVEPGQMIFGYRKLPFGVTDIFLRSLHARCDGVFARHLLAVALAYEGRTMLQIADALDGTRHSVSKWVNAFIRNGVAGIAPFRPAGQVPNRRDFSASSVATLAAGAVNQEYRKRLLAISDAYRSIPLIEIARTNGLSYSTVHGLIREFEAYGPAGLSSGEATVTPDMRDDYTAERLRAIASETFGDDRCRQRLEAMAQLYDGVTMIEASRLVGGLPAIQMMVDRFNRLGHGIMESFNANTMAPTAPDAQRRRKPKLSSPRRPRAPAVPAIALPMAMRDDFNAISLFEFRDRIRKKERLHLDIIIDTYEGISRDQVMEERGVTQKLVTRILNRFNEHGLEWLLASLKPSKMPGRAAARKPKKEPRQEPKFPMRTDWDLSRVRNAMFCTVDEDHRKELEVVLHLYQIGKVGTVATRLRVPSDRVLRIAADFNTHGVTLGFDGRAANMLPLEYDEDELRRWRRSDEPLHTYVQIVAALYGGRHPEKVRATWDLKRRELLKIVRTFRTSGVSGLSTDPLNARAQMPRSKRSEVKVIPKPPEAAKPAVAIEAPRQVAIKEAPKQAMPKAPAAATGDVPRWPFPPMLEKPPVPPPSPPAPVLPRIAADIPRKASLADRLRSYSVVARHPHERALVAVLLNVEGRTVNSAARRLDMDPTEVEAWINLYHRRGAKAFLSAERLSLHPLRPQDKSSAVRALARKTRDELYEKRLLIVADSIDGDDMVNICERHEVAYDEAEICIAAYSRMGLVGVVRAEEAVLTAPAPEPPVQEPPKPAPPKSPAPVPQPRPKRRSKPVAREYIPPPPSTPPQPVQSAIAAPAQAASATAMFEGKNGHRLEAVREFHRNRNLQAVARQFNVGPSTLEKWLIAYVKTGMAERDRGAAQH